MIVNNGIAIEWAESSQPMNGSVEAVETAVDDLVLLVVVAVDCETAVEIEILVVATDGVVDGEVTIVLLTVIIIVAVVVMLLDELFGLEVELFEAD